MKLWKKIALSLAMLLVGFSLAVAGLVAYVTNDMCGNDMFSEVLSPNGKHKVVVFQRDCGATTGFSTQISIMGSNDELENESGNIYIIDGHPKDVSPVINWASDTELNIDRNLSGSEYKAESSWGFLKKIKVTYGTGSS